LSNNRNADLASWQKITGYKGALVAPLAAKKTRNTKAE